MLAFLTITLIGVLAFPTFASPPELADEMIPSKIIWGVSKAQEKEIIGTMATIRFNYKGDFIGVGKYEI